MVVDKSLSVLWHFFLFPVCSHSLAYLIAIALMPINNFVLYSFTHNIASVSVASNIQTEIKRLYRYNVRHSMLIQLFSCYFLIAMCSIKMFLYLTNVCFMHIIIIYVKLAMSFGFSYIISPLLFKVQFSVAVVVATFEFFFLFYP